MIFNKVVSLIIILVLTYLVSMQLINGQEYYKAHCDLIEEIDQKDRSINLSIFRNRISIQVKKHWKWCEYIEDNVISYLYDCRGYEVIFQDHLRYMIVDGLEYKCAFENDDEYQMRISQ